MLLINDHATNAGPRCPMSGLAITPRYRGSLCPAGCRRSHLYVLIPTREAIARTGQTRPTWHAAVRTGAAPASSWQDESGGCWWLPSEVDRYAANRPGVGRRGIFKTEANRR